MLQDISGDMLALARVRIERDHVGDVETELAQHDAEELDLPPASLDAIVSRAAIMYFVDVVGAEGSAGALSRSVIAITSPQ